MEIESELNTVFKALVDVIKRKKSPATASEVNEVLKNRYNMSKSEKWVRNQLERMVLEKRVKKIKTYRSVFYFPLGDIKEGGLQGVLDDFIEVRKSESLEEIAKEETVFRSIYEVKEQLKKLDNITTTNISEDIALTAVKMDFVHRHVDYNKLYADIAREIAAENPRELFFEMFKTLMELFRKYAEDYKKAQSSEQALLLRRRLEKIKEIIFKIYGYLLGIPISFSPFSSRRPMEVARIRLPDEKTGEYVLDYDLNLLEKYLKTRILDESFIVFESPSEAKPHDIFVGVDTSTHLVNVNIIPFLRTEMQLRLNTLVAWSERFKGNSSSNDSKYRFFPRPESLEHMDEKIAEEEGFIISPSTLLSYPEDFHDRIREAQMNALEHIYVSKLILVDPLERDIYEILRRTPDVIYLDGRIFPYEHKLDDLVAVHGKYVRKSIVAYNNMVSLADAKKDDVVVVGVVKRGHLGYFSVLINWYLYKKGHINEDDFLGISEDIGRTLLKDDKHLVFVLLNSLKSAVDGKVPRTFAVIRRFYAMDQNVLRGFGKNGSFTNENNPDYWMFDAMLVEDENKKGIAGYVKDKGYDDDDAWVYAEACAKGAVAMFYFYPPGFGANTENLILPRYDVLIPPSYLKEGEELRDSKIKSMIRRVLVKGNKDYYMGYIDLKEEQNRSILIVPRHIYHAHYYAKNFQKELEKGYTQFIIERALDHFNRLREFFYAEAD